MLTEAKWVSQLLKAARDTYGGWGVRLSALQRYGCPDMLLVLPSCEPILIETKVTSVPDLRKGGSITVEATALQRETLRQIQRAGGRAGIWVLVSNELVLVSRDPDVQYLKIGEAPAMLKERGRPWPISALISRTVT